MMKLLNACKEFIIGISEGIQKYKTYKAGKVK